MKLSIITVNLNNKTGLDHTFESINNQSWQSFEYIVIDGGSNDGSLLSIEQNKRINTYISEPDLGVYDAMNKGIKLASGEYLLFLNSGDQLHQANTLELVNSQLERDDIIYGNLEFVSQNSSNYVYVYPSTLTFQFLFNKSLGHPATFIKKALFLEYGYYEISYKIIADWVFFINTIVKRQVKTKHINTTISLFEDNGMSSLPENQNQILQDREKFLKSEFELLYSDFVEFNRLQHELKKIKSAKGFKWLKALGVKKFQ